MVCLFEVQSTELSPFMLSHENDVHKAYIPRMPNAHEHLL